MGYRHTASGFIQFKSGISAEQIKELLKDAAFDYEIMPVQVQKQDTEAGLSVDVQSYNNYHEEYYFDTFKIIEPFVYDGEIYCVGEDDERWAFFFDDGHFKEESGFIVYNSTMQYYLRLENVVKKMIEEIESSSSASDAAEFCKHGGLNEVDLMRLGLSYLADLW